ncbi:MAG: rod shape-determining protein MreC [Hydrotalea flava]|uniref:rod shape-determining protein MreC n=1 Tax=Hydrotalea TaxID=1004300 RepID=UPI0009436557|nr:MULTISPECIES: rod shape-determining protein MreC [Hydrotalea]MBY0347941.1 rod shape-determining protein MreC [Hydrotalea flava]NIM35948.1 rod shape-determining protein MreC [Hydrotalea flava]NIM38781.1 rod shape-determining protein MreC [Hydrotalea flava]NIN03969.1 rod shape-determining protein MreC [Hydrotalea flava]NIN15690.1 rod shape-determining protein MreC [Hydrotalea flava]
MKNIFLFIRRFFVFICFIVLQITSMVFLSKYSKTHEVFFGAVTGDITGKIYTQFNDINSYFSLRKINQQLAEENAALRNRLKADFQIPDTSKIIFTDTLRIDSLQKTRKYIFLPARVVGNSVSSQTNYLTLQRGANQDIKKGMAVMGPQGIVGVVIDVSPNYSRVMSLLHRNSKVSAMLKKDNSFGSIEWDGDNPNELTLRNISKGSVVNKGDTVVTSSYSANFPPGLMIGTVSGTENEAASNFYTLKVKPATNFYTLQYVYIIANKYFNEQTNLENAKLKNE